MAATLAVAALTAATAPAQSLADAARAAEEQSKAQKTPSPVFTNANDLAFHDVLLTDAVIARFGRARRSLSLMYALNPTIYETVRAGTLAVARFREFGAVLASEPKIVQTLNFYGFDPDSFIFTEIAIRNSLARVERTEWGSTDVQRQNVFYVRDKRTLDWSYYGWQQDDRGRSFWPENASSW